MCLFIYINNCIIFFNKYQNIALIQMTVFLITKCHVSDVLGTKQLCTTYKQYLIPAHTLMKICCLFNAVSTIQFWLNTSIIQEYNLYSMLVFYDTFGYR